MLVSPSTQKPLFAATTRKAISYPLAASRDKIRQLMGEVEQEAHEKTDEEASPVEQLLTRVNQ